ncbi:glutamyl-tRNA(Gln) amidotransferase subunit A, mitochondrial [Cylas formicarius]|uniref:glutamyl-tRNA(Gln) amidotransferase subunit A, mitochondrial n=1 Tax=Cylas formicarius TaxID=197179 RepID=UPI0029589903|nr:glutamyl-tRNA(Gln) amidotransferase subunit A, mitochondrial [Cylas formicarius]
MDKLLSLSINNVSKLLADNSVSPQLVTSLALKRVSETKKYNAFVTVAEKTATESAQRSEKRIKDKNVLSELDGIPVAVKDNFCTRGLKTTCASKMLHDFVPTYNATVVERLLNAGAVLLGKSNLDEFAMGSGTVDSIYGATRNVWGYEDERSFHISGGSSGGSAVAVATGACFGALGSDSGGSTRNPASYCGVVGFKPTYGLVSRWGLIPLVNSMDVPGILTRTVDDCASILNVIAGHDSKDSTSRPSYRKIRLPPADKMTIRGLRVGIPAEYHGQYLCREVREAWNEVANLLLQHGATVEQVSMPNTEYSIVCYSILNQCEVASNMARYDGLEYGFRADENSSTEKLFATTRSLGFNEIVRNRILTGNYFLLTRNYDKYFTKALKVRRKIADDFDRVWERVQILLTPTTPTTAPLYSEFVQKTNRDQCALHDYCTQPANMAGCPAISIPIRLSESGMPIGLQLIGRNLSEPMLLAVAKYIENVVQFPHFVRKF